MPDQINVAFWNVQNLFEVGAVSRGPQTQQELDEKLDVLAAEIDGFFNGDGPDLLGLAEVHTLSVFNNLVDRLSGDYRRIWESAVNDDHTGLGLIARSTQFDDLSLLEVWRPSIAARPRSVIAQCRVTGVTTAFLFVINHWKSRLGRRELSNADRLETGDWLANYLANVTPLECVLVIGDFNAEPPEPPFGELRLRGRRTFRGAFASSPTAAYLYNTGWKFMAEADTWENASVPNYVEPRPTSSHGDSGDGLFDFLLVSKRALKNGPLSLREATVELYASAVTSRHNRHGALRPKKWNFVSPGEHEGSSDHFPLLASFDVN